ncbi:hypothetical protein PybrP1_006581 [[Pythium] brassicae (nom. inval.)]|nr:hypothetical protein PybrP1_006581 [[Pythium] brassicae (nom. inval.)]
MGHCLSKFSAAAGVSDMAQSHDPLSDSPLAIPQQALKSKNLVAPHPSATSTPSATLESPPIASSQSPVVELQEGVSSKDLAHGRSGAEDAAPIGRMKRSQSLAVRNPAGRVPVATGASTLVAAAAGTLPASGDAATGGGPTTLLAENEHESSKESGASSRRHVSLRATPTLQRRGSHRSSKGPAGGAQGNPTQSSRRAKKPATVTLEVLFRDERARLGFFTYLQATALQEKFREVEGETDEAKVLKRRMSKLTSSRVTSDYREDCVLFWLEMSDLLKIPSGGSFQLGLMRDLFDVYIARGALRQLPMVSAAEREPLAQFLQDKNSDRALLAYKMLLLDVLEVVTTHFDEYVRADGKLGFAHATRSASVRNVLARLAKVNLGNPGDRRVHLNEIVCTPALCRIFREFLEERNSVESLLFVIDALAFEDLVNTFALEPELQAALDGSHHDFCLRQAQKIFSKYVRYGSKAEICLGGAVKEKLLREIVEFPIGADVFSDAVLVCSAELVHSHLDQFYGSAAYLGYKAAQSHVRAAKSGRKTSGTILKRSSFDGSGGGGGVANSGDKAAAANGGDESGGNRLADSADQEAFAGGPLLSLPDILNGGGASYFRDFLKEEGAENTLFFYKEVAEYQLLPHGQHHYIQSKARKVFDKFVRRGGKLEVDLPADVRRDILWKLSAPTEHTFADAQKYVLNVWEHNFLPRFRRHRLYSDMMAALHKLPHYGLAAGPGAGADARPHSYASAVAASSSGDVVDVARITLREFLELDLLRRHFRRFLEKEQCANELFFYFEILSFQQFPTSDYLSRQAKKIFSRFCEPTSREFVALATDLRAELQANLNSPRPAMFNKAQEEIVAFFATTLFPKFQHSELYRTIRITHAELRLAKLAATGADVGSAVHVRGRAGAFGGDPSFAPRPSTSPVRGRASVATGMPAVELSEEQVTVKLILEHQETRALFLFFSEEIFCTESIYFWLDCNEFKDIPHKSYLKLRAQKIYRKYISGQAKLQVNVESAIIREIVAHLDDPSRTLFVPAQVSITKMLERDTLPKFRRSKHQSQIRRTHARAMSSSTTPTHATASRDTALDARENRAPLGATTTPLDAKMSSSTPSTPRRALQPLDTNRVVAAPRRPATASGDKNSPLKRKHHASDESHARPLKQRGALSPEFARDRESENLAWLDMLVALLARKYGAHAAPLDLAALEGANVFAPPRAAAAAKTGSASANKSGAGCRRGSGQHAPGKELVAVKEEPARDADEREKEARRQRVLDCKNSRRHQAPRLEAIQNYLTNDPRAFSFASHQQSASTAGFLHLLPQKSSSVVLRGCRCKKSKCLKKYCDCFQNGAACSAHCRCVECANDPAAALRLHEAKRVAEAQRTRAFHAVQLTVTKKPKRNAVQKSIRLAL